MCNFTLGKEHAESHADGLKAPRNAKDKEEFAVQDLENDIGQKLFSLLRKELVSEKQGKPQ